MDRVPRSTTGAVGWWGRGRRASFKTLAISLLAAQHQESYGSRLP
ncbi:hypothetical protein ACN6K9_001210 [Streptomyces sp. SAS_267]